MNQSVDRKNEKRTKIAEIGPDHVEKTILLSARVQTSRTVGKSLVLLLALIAHHKNIL